MVCMENWDVWTKQTPTSILIIIIIDSYSQSSPQIYIDRNPFKFKKTLSQSYPQICIDFKNGIWKKIEGKLPIKNTISNLIKF